MRTLASLRHDETLRLRTLATPAARVIGRFRRLGNDTLRIVPEPPLPKPLCQRGRPAAWGLPALATIEAGRRIRGARESIDRGARQGLINGIVLFAALGALVGAMDDGGRGGNDRVLGPITPWEEHRVA